MNIYKVVKIIDQYRVVVNCGKNDGISENDVLEIFETGQEIFDPDTKASLGTLDIIKAKLTVKDVFPKMCLCTNRDTKTSNILRSPLDFSRFDFETPSPLNVETTEISGAYPNTSKIKIGDLVRKVD